MPQAKVLTEKKILEIEEKIGYSFRDKELLERCFMHSTYTKEKGGENNEKLEFLGDAVISLVVAKKLYHEEANEGNMTEHRKKLVALTPLAKAVRKMGIEGYLIHCGTSRNVGEKSISSLFETVAGGIFLDGGLDAAERFIICGLENIEDDSQTDYKGMLQEYTQACKSGLLPRYGRAEQEGKDNDPTYTVRVYALGQMGIGVGKRIKEAERMAAKDVLKKLPPLPKRIKD